MRKIKVAISAPINDNLYSLIVTKLCLDNPNIKIVGIVCLKTFTPTRIYKEFKRLKNKLFIKILKKYLIANKNDEIDNVHLELKHKYNLQFRSLKRVSKSKNIDFLKVNSPNDPSSVSFLKKRNPDLILSIGSIILRENLLKIPNIGTLNVHMGILPQFRGIGVTEWPIIEAKSLDEVNLGISLHFVEKGVDTGPILLKKKIPIVKEDTFNSIESKFLPEMIDAMMEGIKIISLNKYNKKIQTVNSGKQYFFLHHRMKEIYQKKLNSFFNEK